MRSQRRSTDVVLCLGSDDHFPKVFTTAAIRYADCEKKLTRRRRYVAPEKSYGNITAGEGGFTTSQFAETRNQVEH